MALAGNTPTPDSPRAVALAPTPATPTRPESTEPEASKPEPTKPEATKPETPEPTKPMPEPTKPATKPDSTKKEPLDPGPAGQPNPDRREIGTFTTRENVVLTRGRGATAWSRVLPDKRVFTADPIVALPGYRGRINLDSGLQLLLWGSVPELLDLPPAQALQVPIFESAVILHAPAEGLAADLTLLRGRVKLSRGTAAGDIRVRLRFGEERWDVTLRGENAEVLVDLINSYPPDAPFSADGTGEKPGTDVSLGVTGGQAVVKPGDRASVNLSAPPGQAALVWNSKEGTPETREVKTAPAGWNEKYPTTDQAKGVLQAAEEFSRSLSTSPSLEVALDKARKDKSPFANRLAVFAYGAIDSPVDLVDCLDDANYVVRLTAVPVLRHWQAQRPENDLKLVEVLNKQKGYTTRQADTMLRMLHGFADPNDAATIDLLTDALTSNKLGMRELAFEQMYQLDPKGFARARYSPVADQEFRDKAAADWKADWKKRQP
jgi:hypothetical protein